MWVGLAVSVLAGWWSRLTRQRNCPWRRSPLRPTARLFAPWASEDAGGAWDGREGQLAPDCEWWNGTYYYDPSLCSHMSVTRMPATHAQQAVERATRCAAHGDTDCVLSGEIGLNLPAAFVYDEEPGHAHGRGAQAARDCRTRSARRCGCRTPKAEHPNQLFTFQHVVRVEYLKAATRTMETLELRGNDAYCMQALRRSVVPTCWTALD